MDEDCGDCISHARAPQPQAMHAAADLGEESSAQALVETRTPVPQESGALEDVDAAGTNCRFTLQVTFFFDGTGNNRDADEPTHKNSNVDRLFRAHEKPRPASGLFRIYIPGIGTYFPDIGDPGGTDRGNAMGAYGEPRLVWAMQELDKIVARYPPDKLVELRIATFGFSRGSALARAFAIRVAARFRKVGHQWHWNTVDIPVRFYFLGLFETVAAVGLVPTGETVNALKLATGRRKLDVALAERRGDLTCGIRALALGRPGADPTPSVTDGHMAWASDLRIPEQVEQCVSMIAAHEQRNSFALDSVRQGDRYPGNCIEMMFPGMHSDVGGGYRPGAQGRSMERRQILAQMPLLSMHKIAIEHGVPLQGVSEFTEGDVIVDFQVSPELLKQWNHYMDTAGRGGRPLGEMLLAHTRYWYAWRFHRIHRFLNRNGTWKHGDVLPDQARIEAEDRKFAAERQAQQARVDELENAPARLAAQASLEHAQAAYEAALRSRSAFGGHLAERLRARQQAEEQLRQANDPCNRARARLAAIPGSHAVKRIHAYDIELMKDMAVLRDQAQVFRGYRMRPHYRMVLEAYEAQFVHDNGLKDDKIIAFFDDYVHDSLAGFAKDVTLPSDPRCVYVGGDREVEYANATQLPGQRGVELADAREPEATAGPA